MTPPPPKKVAIRILHNAQHLKSPLLGGLPLQLVVGDHHGNARPLVQLSKGRPAHLQGADALTRVPDQPGVREVGVRLAGQLEAGPAQLSLQLCGGREGGSEGGRERERERERCLSITRHTCDTEKVIRKGRGGEKGEKGEGERVKTNSYT